MIVAALLVALAMIVIIPGSGRSLLVQRLGSTESHVGVSLRERLSRVSVSKALTRVLAVVCSLAGSVGAGFVVGPGAAVIAGLLPFVILLGVVRFRSNKRHNRMRARVAEGCLLLSSELDAGATASAALETAADVWPDVFSAASSMVRVGKQPVEALRSSAKTPGAESLNAVAAAWEVSNHTGASLSPSLVAVSDSLRAEVAVEREVDTQLATVKTTARVLALLPVALLLIFSNGESDPLSFLLRTPYGFVCVVIAVVCIGAGLLWIDRTTRTAAVSPWS